METAIFTFNGKSYLNHFTFKVISYPLNFNTFFINSIFIANNMKLHIILLFLLVFFTMPTLAKVKISIIHGKTQEGIARIKIKNETKVPLACYVAIDGRKVKFHIPPYLSSKWIQATDSRFNYRHFSTWCDYLELHPEYKTEI